MLPPTLVQFHYCKWTNQGYATDFTSTEQKVTNAPWFCIYSMSDECVWKQRLLARVKTLWREKRKSFYGELKRNTRHSMFYQLLFCDGISWCVVFGQFSPPLIPWEKNSPSLAGIPLVFCFDEHPLNFMTFIFCGTWTTVDRWSFSLMSFTINLSELTSKEQRVIYSLLPLWLK